MRRLHLTGEAKSAVGSRRFARVGTLCFVLVLATGGAVCTASSVDYTSADPHDSHASHSTVTINGTTVELNGDSYSRTVTSTDGSTRVDISVHHTSQASGHFASKEGDMP